MERMNTTRDTDAWMDPDHVMVVLTKNEQRVIWNAVTSLRRRTSVTQIADTCSAIRAKLASTSESSPTGEVAPPATPGTVTPPDSQNPERRTTAQGERAGSSGSSHGGAGAGSVSVQATWKPTETSRDD